MNKEYRNILIVRTDRIVDVILTTPVIQALRTAFPRSRIAMMVAPPCRELVEGNPYLDEVIVDDKKNKHKGGWGTWKLVRQLRRKKFDVAVILHTKHRTNLICFLAGIPIRVGYENEKFGFLLTKKLRDTRPWGIKHESEYCLDVARAMGAGSGSPKIFMPIKDEAKAWLKTWRTSKKLLLNKQKTTSQFSSKILRRFNTDMPFVMEP